MGNEIQQLKHSRGTELEEKASRDAREKNNVDDYQDFDGVAEDVAITSQRLISGLRYELEEANAEIAQLKAIITDKELANNSDNEGNGIIDIIHERNELLKTMCVKDAQIERMSSNISLLEQQLKAAVSAKFDVLARLDASQGNVFTLLFKDTQMQMLRQRKDADSNPDSDVPFTRKRSRKDRFEFSSTRADDNDAATFEMGITSSKRSREDENYILIPSSPASDDDDAATVEMGPTSSNSREEEDIVIANGGSDNVSSSSHHPEKKDKSNSPNMELELLSQVRTRRQTEFLIDVLSGGSNNRSKSVNEGLLDSQNGKKGRVKVESTKKPARGRRCYVKIKKIEN